MASDEVMKNYFARFIGHQMMFMRFSSDVHKSQKERKVYLSDNMENDSIKREGSKMYLRGNLHKMSDVKSGLSR